MKQCSKRESVGSQDAVDCVHRGRVRRVLVWCSAGGCKAGVYAHSGVSVMHLQKACDQGANVLTIWTCSFAAFAVWAVAL
eukprot:3156400-Amphidinium_carterae.1